MLKELQEIAMQWHGGQASPLYAFGSSGTITEGLVAEIKVCLREAYPEERPDLERLLEYVKHRSGEGC